MAFWQRIFGQKNTPTVEPTAKKKFSFHDFLLKQNIPVFPKQCDAPIGHNNCGTIFWYPFHKLEFLTTKLDKWELDIGGYCSSCRQNRCSKHAKWVAAGIPMSEKSDEPNRIWAPGCSTCGSILTSENAASVISHLLVDDQTNEEQ